MEDRTSAAGETAGSDTPPVDAAVAELPGQPHRTRVDPALEAAALACIRAGQRDEALKILMVGYGPSITAFALRVVRNAEIAKDVRQQVFLDAYQGMRKFEGRSSLWHWLCRIAYHRCLDELKRGRRAGTEDDFDVWEDLPAPPDPRLDAERIARERALEDCLAQLSPALRTQLLMRYSLGLSHEEIGEAVGAPHGTVQVRISRILFRLRRCLQDKGVAP